MAYRSQRNGSQREQLAGMGQLARIYFAKEYLDQAADPRDLSNKELQKIFNSNHPDVPEIDCISR
jgi:hypothetical protein